MARKKKTNEELLQENIIELEKSLNHWNEINTIGCSDPFWSDGVNLNLVRTHIEIYKRDINEICQTLQCPLPEVWYKETPPEVNQDYYAQADTIKANAKKIIEKVESAYNLNSYKDGSSLVKYFKAYKQALEENHLSYIKGKSLSYFEQFEKDSEKKLHNFNESNEGQLKLNENMNITKQDHSINAVLDQREKLIPLYNRALNVVKSDWINYLNCVSNLYKHNHTNQVMIFSQSLNNEFVTEEKTWNKLGRYINFNAKYIISIASKNNILIEHRLYDISQTYGKEFDIDTQRFEVSDNEDKLLTSSLSSKYNLNAESLKNAIQMIISGMYINTPLTGPIKNYERLIKNSVFYVVCKKLNILPNIDYTHKFRDINLSNINQISQIAKLINTSSHKILNNIEKNLTEIRSKENERDSNNKRRELHSGGDGLVEGYKERNTLQAGTERNKWNTDIGTSNRDSTAGGQLFFGQIWQSSDETYGGKSQRQILGADSGRNSDEETSRERGTTQGNEVLTVGTNREKTSSSENRRFHENSTAPGMDRPTGGGNGERGTLQTDLSGVKVGDFLELYGIDAEITAKELELTLTNKLIGNENVSMVGFPISSLHLYTQKLSDKGFQLKIDLTDKINFRYSSTVTDNDSAAFYGGAKAKYKNNIEAIKLLKQIESEDRLATADEQYTLARYTGFGGISQAFHSKSKGWEDEFTELKTLLTPIEYEKARESTLTAYYTEPQIIGAMYKGIMNLGVDANSKILEPSMGVGNFFSMLPEQLQQCELHGVELDDLTGRIAKQLYQKATIQIKGYQDTKYQDDFFDCSVGNVPFGEFKVFDERYLKENLLIHDYFFAKTVDKVKPNGIISFISSKGTMDKANSSFRKYIAQRAELIGAVRLPNTAFKAIAGTEVTTDIIFLRKREKPIVCEPEWVHVGLTDDNVPVNQYYLDNPQNLLGKMIFESSQFGQSAVLKPFDNFDLYGELEKRINIFTKSAEVKKIGIVTQVVKDKAEDTLPADPNVKNYTYTVIDDNIYYRENETMLLQDFSGMKAERIKSLHEIRLALREVIDIQVITDYSPDELKPRHNKLNQVYDAFVKKYGYITDKVNKNVFEEDSDSPLLLSVEDTDKEKNIIKSKIFSQATIRPKKEFVPQTYDDLITLSMSMKGQLDIEYMAVNFNRSPQEVIDNLKGKIYLNPQFKKWETADEYLTGNVKAKLDYAIIKSKQEPELYQDNVIALEKVQPKPLEIDEIDYKLGSSWIDIKYSKQFMYELSGLPNRYRQSGDNQSNNEVCLTYNKYTSEYTIYNKSLWDTVKTTSAYGTQRKPFFAIVEDTLNLRDCKVTDRITDSDGKEKQVPNFKETQLARKKQELVKNEFKNWICSDISRLQDIVKTYNERFNVYRPRTFDGSHLTYDGMSNFIQLREHQNNAVARCLYGGKNVLLGHVVGAGKTYTMVAAAMELKRIGIANKPLFVVPNHLTEQWGGDFLKLYPTANILVATKKDFEPANRKRFIGKICTGDYDAVIIGHTQFEKVPMSNEYVHKEMKEQIDQITAAIQSISDEDGQRFTIKQLENQKKKLEAKLKGLNSKKKDNVITFEQTGVDQIFIDEAHNYKNCFVHTKMSNIAGVTTSNAQKSFDMLMKSKYISNKNDGKGVVFATGTPISNSMTELFVMQRYLQPDALRDTGVSYFDEWASTFGQTVAALELKPEGKGYRMKTRFAKFYNLPELINMFSQVADIKVAADLDLPVPKMATGKPIIVVSKPSDYIKEYISTLGKRADRVHDGSVDPSEDNMLKITGEGRMVALDARLIDPNSPTDYDSKVFKCCNNIYDLYQKTNNVKGCQLVFCDLSTPKGGKIPMKMVDGVAVIDKDTFTNIYDEVKKTLIEKGMLEDEIAYIHDATTGEQKAQLFAKCRSGEIRVLIGSTQKMGAGTNVRATRS